MKILIFTYSITRKAGGVFNAVCDLFTNKAFTGEEIKIFSYNGILLFVNNAQCILYILKYISLIVNKNKKIKRQITALRDSIHKIIIV